MSNLIITIISIALVAVAAVMGVFYGGTAFSNSSMSAYATQTINTMQQIKAAYTMQQLDGVTGPYAFAVNSKYLNLPVYTNYTFGSYNINYGAAGNLLDWASGTPLSGTAHVWYALLQVRFDPSNNPYVMLLVNGPQSGSDQKFYGQFCTTLNKQLGQFPYAASLTLTSYYGVQLPVVTASSFAAYNPGSMPAGVLTNICGVDSGDGNMVFYIQI